MATSSIPQGRMEQRIDALLKEGNYYEAHQLYRTLFSRYLAQKKVPKALELVERGTLHLLEAKQWESGADLAVLMVGRLKEDRIPLTDTILESLAKIHGLFGKEAKARERFMKAAIKWSSMVCEDFPYGHPFLHRLQAMAYWDEKNYSNARQHFLHSDRLEDFGVMLLEYAMKEGYPHERELFLAQAVLQMLALKKTAGAEAVFIVFTQKHPDLAEEEPPFQHAPLANFLWFLISTITRSRDPEVFVCLRSVYHPALDQDQSYHFYLDQIGETYFGLKVNPASDIGSSGSGGGGIMDGLFSMLSGDTGETGQALGGLGGLLNSLVNSLGRGGGGGGGAEDAAPILSNWQPDLD